MSKFTFVKVGLAAMLAGSGVFAVATNAFAATGVQNACTIYDVGVDTNGTRLTIHCVNDSNHYTAGYGGTCPVAGADQIKAWHSQAMAALLAGKKVNIWWNDACGSRAMTGFVMTHL